MAKKRTFTWGPTWEILSGIGGAVLPAQVANQNEGFTLSFLLAD